MRGIFLLFCFFQSVWSNPLFYYKNEFQKSLQHPSSSLKDTLFSKIIWHKKVSNILVEERQSKFDELPKYRMTLLMISPWPDTYKSSNYELYYEFSSPQAAAKKLHQINDLLVRSAVLQVHILGNRIIREKIIFSGYTKKEN